MRITRQDLELTVEAFNNVFGCDAKVVATCGHYAVWRKHDVRTITSGSLTHCNDYLHAMMEGKYLIDELKNNN